MTPAEEATFCALWEQGLTHEAIAEQLGCPLGTVKSRLHRLIQQGTIQPRRSRRTPALTTPDGPPARPPRGTHVPTRGDTRGAHPRSPSWPSPKSGN
jgi:hypothetical protein